MKQSLPSNNIQNNTCNSILCVLL